MAFTLDCYWKQAMFDTSFGTCYNQIRTDIRVQEVCSSFYGAEEAIFE
ncbi:hypothetical protein [Peribacillus muralis]|nr:hypothetical protein [Peribacillus muralis]